MHYSSALSLITPDDGTEPIVTAANCRLVESSLQSCVSYLEMRSRKRKAEEESYRIARESVYGWRTEQIYRKDAVFTGEDDFDIDTQWWQKPELSREKKKEKIKQADREAKFQLSNRGQQKFGSSFQSDSFESGHQTSQSWQPHPYGYGYESRRCDRCHTVGHIARDCRVSSDRVQQQQPRSYSGYNQRHENAQHHSGN